MTGLALLAAPASAQERGDWTVAADRVYAAPGKVLDGAAVVTSDGKIRAVVPGKGSGESVLRAAAVTPGMIDLSVRITRGHLPPIRLGQNPGTTEASAIDPGHAMDLGKTPMAGFTNGTLEFGVFNIGKPRGCTTALASFTRVVDEEADLLVGRPGQPALLAEAPRRANNGRDALGAGLEAADEPNDPHVRPHRRDDHPVILDHDNRPHGAASVTEP